MKLFMKTLTHPHHRMLIAATSAALALAAMGFASAAHARDNVTFSVGIGGPGVLVGASNGYPVPYPVYSQPQAVYVQPRPVYVQPAPVYYQPAPVYYSNQPVYIVPQPVYYGRSKGWHGHHGKHHERDDDHGYERGHQRGYGQGYAPVYYQR